MIRVALIFGDGDIIGEFTCRQGGLQNNRCSGATVVRQRASSQRLHDMSDSQLLGSEVQSGNTLAVACLACTRRFSGTKQLRITYTKIEPAANKAPVMMYAGGQKEGWHAHCLSDTSKHEISHS